MGRGRKRKCDFVPKPWIHNPDSGTDQDVSQDPLQDEEPEEMEVDDDDPRRHHYQVLQRQLDEQLQLEERVNQEQQLFIDRALNAHVEDIQHAVHQDHLELDP